MRNTKYVIFILMLSIAVCFAVGEMSVKDIIELYEEGLSIAVIKASIEAKDATFDLDTDDIKELHKAEIPDELITYMLDRKPGEIDTDTSISGAKVGTLTVNLDVDYGLSSKNDDLNVYIALGVDDIIKYSEVSWNEKIVLGEGSNEINRYKISFVKSVSVSREPGDCVINLYLWTGEGRVDVRNLSAYTVFMKTVSIKSGAMTILDLTITESGDGKAVVVEG